MSNIIYDTQSSVMKSGVIYEFVSWQENVSLADILSLRDSCLTEQDIWAICLECCHSLKSIAHSAIFQTLCITPDTLAFNTNGNVCFMEQLSGKYLCFQAICFRTMENSLWETIAKHCNLFLRLVIKIKRTQKPV